MWNDDIKVSVHSASFHYILANVVHQASGVHFCLICIYGDPYHKQTSTIWSQVSTFVYDNLGKPMMCMGDLNDILYDTDGCNGSVNYYRMSSFRSLVKNCGFLILVLVDLRALGVIGSTLLILFTDAWIDVLLILIGVHIFLIRKFSICLSF
ncbi:hypothetical protein VPH35_113643 [Triticum aestivum]